MSTLILTSNILYASNDNVSKMNNEVTIASVLSLLPSTPKEADFEDYTTLNFTDIAPVTPTEADFSDDDYEMNPAFSTLVPVTPINADFSDSEIQITDIRALAPVTPSVANFEDLN